MLIKETFFLWGFSFLKIPLIFFVRPKVQELSLDSCKIHLPFKCRNKNHVSSMYLGAITVSAELAAGLLAVKHIKRESGKINLVFKEMKAKFHKRIEGDAICICTQGDEVAKAISEAKSIGERQNVNMKVLIYVPSKFGDETLAEFDFVLSFKLS